MRQIDSLVESAVTALRRQPSRRAQDGQNTALVFAGNWQDPCPRALLQDRELSPLAVVLWQHIRIQSDPEHPGRFPNYESLTNALQASEATIAGGISLLRVTRWLMLCGLARDARGRFLGQIYALADARIGLNDVLRWDPGFLEFVNDSTAHRRRSVSRAAKRLLLDLEQDALAPPKTGFSHLDSHQAQPSLTSKDGHRLQKLKTATLYTLKSSTKSSSKDRPQPVDKSLVVDNLNFPEILKLLPTQKQLIALRLAQLDGSLAQSVLDEAAGRIRLKRATADPVRSHFDYLTGLIRRAHDGDFVFSDAGERIRAAREEGEMAAVARRYFESKR